MLGVLWGTIARGLLNQIDERDVVVVVVVGGK